MAGREHWYVVAESSRLGQKPLGLTLLDEPLVLFRDETGQARALLDRCPHRAVPLSDGRVTGGRLQCPYHGWEFDGAGQCQYIPALGPVGRIPERACVRTFLVQEQQGYIWVWPGDTPPGPGERPLTLPHHDETGWMRARIQARIHAGMQEVIENFIDCPHTGYVHGGLFRAPASHRATHHVRQVSDGVVIDIKEEQTRSSLLSRLFVSHTSSVVHQDRFIAPSTVRVSYTFGPGRVIEGYQLCTPIDAFKTDVFVYVTWQWGWLTTLFRPIVPFAGRLILEQDRQVLERQAERIRRYGRQFVSTGADTANLWIQAHGQGGDDRETTVEFRL
jgi:phenylpropionate dioxygenase-like ring-hydroxylating dioxygenase large terminal subunit